MIRYKNRAVQILFSGLILCISAAYAWSKNPDISLLWQTNQHTFLESAAIVGDIDSDGRDEIVITGREEMIALDKNGKEIWRWPTRRRFMTYPSILKRDGKPALIYAADDAGLLTCLSGQGKVVWQSELSAGTDWSATVIADLNADGKFEVIQTDWNGTVWILDALNGAVVSKGQLNGKPVSPAAGDIDGDGLSELVITTNTGDLYVLDATGKIQWQSKLGGSSETWSTSAPIIFSASDGKNYIVAASSDGMVYCFDGNGVIRWQQRVRGPVASTLSAADFDQNGQADIFLITQTGMVYRFDENGRSLWELDMQGRSLASGAIIDINNDNRLEYVLCTQRGHLMVLDQAAQVLFEHRFDNRTINVTPAFGNVSGSSNKLEMVITGGESGQTFCFETPAKKSTSAPWSQYRGTARNTGCWTGLSQTTERRMVPRQLAWNKLLAGRDIVFDIFNPKAGTSVLKAHAVCIKPDGAKLTAMTTVTGEKGRLNLPVDFNMPGNYRFSWMLVDTHDRVLFSDDREVVLEPFKNDRALLRETIDQTRQTADKVELILPLSAAALRLEAERLDLQTSLLRSMQDKLNMGDPLTVKNVITETAASVEHALRLSEINTVIDQAKQLGEGTSLIAFEGMHWENRRVDQQLPEQVSNPLQISYPVIPGEHQPVPLVLFNITDRILQVQVQTVVEQEDIKVKALQATPTISSLGEESWDALPAMGPAGMISIPPLSSREVWLDITLGNLPAGKYPLVTRFRAVNGAGVSDGSHAHAAAAPETTVEINLELLPFEMSPSGSFRLCTWSPSRGPELDDLLAHGNNVFLLPHGKPVYSASGEMPSVDFSPVEPILDGLKNHDVIYLIQGFPALKPETGSAAYKSDLKTYLDALVTYLAAQGIDTDHFALYPIDEPGGHGWPMVDQLVAFGKIVRSINPQLMIYQDGGGELPMFKAMAQCLDIWVPPIDWVPEEIPEMQVMRTTGKMLWSYNCSYSYSRPIGPNIKNINLIAEYRTAALFAFRHQTTGMGYWCYNAGRDNPWERITLEYNLVYPGADGPITSRRWEAVREGIEDYRILLALQAFAKTSPDKILKAKINNLVTNMLPDLVDPGFTTMKWGLGRDAIDLVCNEEKMNVFRKEMMNCVREIVNR